jgi:hypothetical protein
MSRSFHVACMKRGQTRSSGIPSHRVATKGCFAMPLLLGLVATCFSSVSGSKQAIHAQTCDFGVRLGSAKYK